MITAATMYIATGFKTVGIALMILDAVVFLGLLVRELREMPLGDSFVGAIVGGLVSAFVVGISGQAAGIIFVLGLGMLVLGLVAESLGLIAFAFGLVVFAYLIYKTITK